MHSIELVPDLGVDAASEPPPTPPPWTKGPKGASAQRKRTPPGRNATFGDLFQVADGVDAVVPSTVSRDGRNVGAAGCVIFIREFGP